MNTARRSNFKAEDRVNIALLIEFGGANGETRTLTG